MKAIPNEMQPAWPVGGGQVGEMLRTGKGLDAEAGDPADWSAALRSLIGTMLDAPGSHCLV
jgi:hypothetical protein|tara:strand:- start:56 stop:238 length:183 start_codon:yes stop_codon:yes gene_type:complete